MSLLEILRTGLLLVIIYDIFRWLAARRDRKRLQRWHQQQQQQDDDLQAWAAEHWHKKR